MSKKEFRTSLKSIMSLAWQMVKKNGFTLSEALKSDEFIIIIFVVTMLTAMVINILTQK